MENRFECIIIDEMQDVREWEYNVIKELFKNVTFQKIGDPNQQIYDKTIWEINNELKIKNSLRKLRDGNGNQLFVDGVNGKEFYSQPIEFSRNGAWDKTKAEIIGADWDKSLVGIRDSLEYEILKEATLEGTLDEDGKAISLAEQDLIGIKATMRLAYLPIKDEAFCAVVPKTV